MNTHDTSDQLADLRIKLITLQREHRDLDEAIEALQDRTTSDMLQLKRLKKQKLSLKDKITKLQTLVLPDIIA